MTIGDGIFYSTVLLVVAGAIYFVSTKGRWKLFAKVVGSLIVIASLAAGGIWIYFNRPSPPDELLPVSRYMGVDLGSKRVDVTLAKGEPEDETDILTNPDTNRKRNGLRYGAVFVELMGADIPDTVTSVCTTQPDLYGDDHELFGINHYTQTDTVLERLGPPTSESINSEGTIKAINYKNLNFTVLVSAGEVNMICTT
ncbi:unnamed protein product, partial [Discosporangium mesarthrocarpum]